MSICIYIFSTLKGSVQHLEESQWRFLVLQVKTLHGVGFLGGSRVGLQTKNSDFRFRAQLRSIRGFYTGLVSNQRVHVGIGDKLGP